MNEAHIHLLTNHFPIIGTLIAIAILLYAFMARNKAVANTGLLLAGIMALMSIPVFLSGEGAEHMVEGQPGISEYFLEEHEELGKTAFWVILGAGAVALLALVINTLRSAMSRTWTGIALLVLVGSFALTAYVGYLGGQINHPEIRDNTATVHTEDEH